jgi:cold-inducible RNA-binding protein
VRMCPFAGRGFQEIETYSRESSSSMSNTVYVGNLSYDTTRESLEAAVSDLGKITEIAMPLDRESGRPRGFAFVTMASREEADAVISQLNGTMLNGRTLNVNEAKERSAGGRNDGRAPRY